MPFPVTRRLLRFHAANRSGGSARPSVQPVHGLWSFPAVGAAGRICRFAEKPRHGLIGKTGHAAMTSAISTRGVDVTGRSHEPPGSGPAKSADLGVMKLSGDMPGGRIPAPPHPARVESLVPRHIDGPDPGPDGVAQGCGISLRCLHEMLRNTDMTHGPCIRDTRLRAAREETQTPADRRAVGEIAHARGFTVPSQFSRAVRARSGLTAKVARGRARGAAHSRGSRAFRGGATRRMTPTKSDPGHHRPKCARNRARAACRSARAASA
ncbi:MAG: helix-turn-helix domain-containing protein [Rhodobacter sp.]|nr:helix-turn-helix domain-containing protein [Rhodobacter sp.]MCA3459495.1 helix-turn-helix domain-containing protein [Rhodobacter sp.]MCA3462663.1 helix-turn-helix domain-containing protein [Rhodobacter sp.]MCA3463812.1 helix-turn-helix domain-containing protein [Rhodobacter sp.]MCA3467232.1 helix-turn-helix domain-containing protein [Rhodobacter sp.]